MAVPVGTARIDWPASSPCRPGRSNATSPRCRAAAQRSGPDPDPAGVRAGRGIDPAAGDVVVDAGISPAGSRCRCTGCSVRGSSSGGRPEDPRRPRPGLPWPSGRTGRPRLGQHRPGYLSCRAIGTRRGHDGAAGGPTPVQVRSRRDHRPGRRTHAVRLHQRTVVPHRLVPAQGRDPLVRAHARGPRERHSSAVHCPLTGGDRCASTAGSTRARTRVGGGQQELTRSALSAAPTRRGGGRRAGPPCRMMGP